MDVFALTATLSLQADNFFSGLADAAEAMARFVADSVKVGAGFDASMSKVSAISGATADEFDTLRELAREAGASTQYTAQEAADALTYMAMAGWKTEQMTSGLSGILDLAAASGEDLARTSDIVTDALTAFGMRAEESGHFADILAAASSNSNTNVSMMGETFKYAASIAGALGYSAEDTALAIGLMANSGIKASQAGTSLRRIMTALQGDVELSGDALGDFSVATVNSDGTMRDFRDILTDLRSGFSQLSESEKASAAEAIAGKYAMSGFLAIMNSSEEDWNKLAAAIDNCNGAAQSMAETMMNNLSGSMKEWNSAVQDFQIALSDKLTPTIREFVDFGTKGMREFTEAFEKEGLDGAIEVFGKFVEDGSNMIQEKLPIFQEKGIKILNAISKGIETASPAIGLVIETLGGMVGDFLQQTSPTIMTTVTTLITSLSPGIMAALKGVVKGLVDSWPAIWEGLKDLSTTLISDIGISIFSALEDWNPTLAGWIAKFTGLETKAQRAAREAREAQEAENAKIAASAKETAAQIEQAGNDIEAAYKAMGLSAEEGAEKSKTALEAFSSIFGESGVDGKAKEAIGNVTDELVKLAEMTEKRYELDTEFNTWEAREQVFNLWSALDDLIALYGYDYNTFAEFTDEASPEIQKLIANFLQLGNDFEKGFITEADFIDQASPMIQPLLEWFAALNIATDENYNSSASFTDNASPVISSLVEEIASLPQGEVSHTYSYYDVITRYSTEGTPSSSTATVRPTNTTGSTASLSVHGPTFDESLIHSRSMFDGTILRGATMFGWDAQGRPQIGGGEGAEAVVGVNSLNQQIREAVRDGLSGIVGSIAQAIGGRNEQPVYVVLDTGELVGAIGGKMDAELGKIGDWKGGGRA